MVQASLRNLLHSDVLVGTKCAHEVPHSLAAVLSQTRHDTRHEATELVPVLGEGESLPLLHGCV